MTEEKQGFIHKFLFDLITEKKKKKKQFKGQKSLTNTFSTTIIEKTIKKRYKRPDWWGITKGFITLCLIFFIGATIWTEFYSQIHINTLTNTDKDYIYHNGTGWIIEEGQIEVKNVTTSALTTIDAMNSFMNTITILIMIAVFLMIMAFIITSFNNPGVEEL